MDDLPAHLFFAHDVLDQDFIMEQMNVAQQQQRVKSISEICGTSRLRGGGRGLKPLGPFISLGLLLLEIIL